MSHELFEVTCVKHQHIEQTANPETWLCKFCKEQKEHPFRHFNRCDKGHKWFGNKSCPECKIDLMKKRAARRVPIENLKQEMTGLKDVVSTAKALDEKRIKRAREERELRESQKILPSLLTEVISQLKELNKKLGDRNV